MIAEPKADTIIIIIAISIIAVTIMTTLITTSIPIVAVIWSTLLLAAADHHLQQPQALQSSTHTRKSEPAFFPFL